MLAFTLLLLVYAEIFAAVYFYMQRSAGCDSITYIACVGIKNDCKNIFNNQRTLFNFASVIILLSLATHINIIFSVITLLLLMILTNIEIAYTEYFKIILTVNVIKNQWREGLIMAPLMLKQFSIKTFLHSIVFFVAQNLAIISLKIVANSYNIQTINFVFYIALAYWILTFAEELLSKFTPSMFTHCNECTLMSSKCGILPIWGFDILFSLKYKFVYSRANHVDDYTATKLANIDISEINNICIVQVESLDYSAIYEQNAMPFLKNLSDNSVICKLQTTPEQIGSADSDFQMIFGEAPIKEQIIMYKVNGYDFDGEQTISKKAKNLGFTSQFFHDYMASYYNRNKCLKNAGFSSMTFIEQLADRTIKNDTLFLKNIADKHMFDVMIQDLKNSKGKLLQFAITCTSHIDWDFIKPEEKHVYPDGEDTTQYKKYINSIRYVDEGLENLYNEYPDRSLFIIYGDHNSRLPYANNDSKTIPFIVAIKGENLSEAYLIDKQLAHSGELFFINAVKWVHQLLS